MWKPPSGRISDDMPLRCPVRRCPSPVLPGAWARLAPEPCKLKTPSLDRCARLTDLSTTRHLNWPSTLGVWAAICFAAALSAPRQGIGGREFPVTLSVFALYLGIALLLAARGITERLLVSYGSATGFFLGLALLIAYLIYALGTHSISLGHASIAIAFVFLPLGLVASAAGTAPGAWQDYVSLGASWVAVKFYLSEWLWPYPGGRLSHILTIFLAAIRIRFRTISYAFQPCVHRRRDARWPDGCLVRRSARRTPGGSDLGIPLRRGPLDRGNPGGRRHAGGR